MRALAVLLGLLISIPVLAASPQIEAAITVIQTVGTDTNRLKTFCELDFRQVWDTAESIDPASEDGKALHAALDRLSERCPHR
jgi:hypothetical protein